MAEGLVAFCSTANIEDIGLIGLLPCLSMKLSKSLSLSHTQSSFIDQLKFLFQSKNSSLKCFLNIARSPFELPEGRFEESEEVGVGGLHFGCRYCCVHCN